jgi:hypothetical protein
MVSGDSVIALLDYYLFRLPYFPFYFVVHVIWICAVIRRSDAGFDTLRSFFTGGFMAFFGRILVAFLCGGFDGFLDHVFEGPIYGLIWVLVNHSLFDLFYQFLTIDFTIVGCHILYCVIQVRHICLGVDTGSAVFGSAAGSVLLSVALSSSESLIWLLFCRETRMFSDRVIRRNLLMGIAYLFVGYSQPFIFKICSLILSILILIADIVLYGVTASEGIDVTFLPSLGRFFRFSGGDPI